MISSLVPKSGVSQFDKYIYKMYSENNIIPYDWVGTPMFNNLNLNLTEYCTATGKVKNLIIMSLIINWLCYYEDNQFHTGQKIVERKCMDKVKIKF